MSVSARGENPMTLAWVGRFRGRDDGEVAIGVDIEMCWVWACSPVRESRSLFGLRLIRPPPFLPRCVTFFPPLPSHRPSISPRQIPSRYAFHPVFAIPGPNLCSFQAHTALNHGQRTKRERPAQTSPEETYEHPSLSQMIGC